MVYEAATWHKNIYTTLGTNLLNRCFEAYGIVTNNNIPIDRLNPNICPNCNERNTQDAKFCFKCKMIMGLGLPGSIRITERKEDELKAMQRSIQYDTVSDAVCYICT